MHYETEVVHNAAPGTLTLEERIRLLVTMLRIRLFEERIGELHVERDAVDRDHRARPATVEPYPERKRIRTPCHLYIGQEAVAAGACATLDRADWVWSTHRAHGHYLAKGGNLVSAMDEVFCRASGCSGGRGGSMHLCAPEVGFLGSSAIVAGTVPLGVGAAMAARARGERRVSMIFHGDAVLEEGVFHESLNWAVLHDLPVVFVCENNLYSTHLHIRHRRRQQDLGTLVTGYGLPVSNVDGNDLRAMLDAVAPAVERARNGDGPTFIQAFTYRWRGHVGPYDNLEVGLRSKDEIERWIERCPIERESERLVAERVLREEEIERLRALARGEIDSAIRHAFDAERPAPAGAAEKVFRERDDDGSARAHLLASDKGMPDPGNGDGRVRRPPGTRARQPVVVR